MTLHLKFTAFIELFSCHTSHWSYCSALFSLLCFLSPHHSSKLSITIIGAYLFILSIFHNATDFVNSKIAIWRDVLKILNMFCIILHIYILTEQLPYHLQNMQSFWKLLKSGGAKTSFGTPFYIAFIEESFIRMG